MGAVLQLERFDRTEPLLPDPLYTGEDVQDAYARGVIEGRAQGRDEQVAQLSAALAGLQFDVEAMQGALSSGRIAQARSLDPLIRALLDGVMPALARARLESALLAAFIQLAETASPLAIELRCGPDLASFVAACADQAGISVTSIASDGPPGTVTAALLGGVMSWDEAALAAQLTALVQEIMEEH